MTSQQKTQSKAFDGGSPRRLFQRHASTNGKDARLGERPASVRSQQVDAEARRLEREGTFPAAAPGIEHMAAAVADDLEKQRQHRTRRVRRLRRLETSAQTP